MDNDNRKQGSYQELLFDKRWGEKRAEILQRDNYKCIICGSMDNLLVHHKQYHFNTRINQKCPPWDYDNKYLITICESCHSRGHQKFQIQMKNINH